MSLRLSVCLPVCLAAWLPDCVRTEMHRGLADLAARLTATLIAKMQQLHDETRAEMRMLHEDVLERIARQHEGKPPMPRTRKKR